MIPNGKGHATDTTWNCPICLSDSSPTVSEMDPKTGFRQFSLQTLCMPRRGEAETKCCLHNTTGYKISQETFYLRKSQVLSVYSLNTILVTPDPASATTRSEPRITRRPCSSTANCTFVSVSSYIPRSAMSWLISSKPFPLPLVGRTQNDAQDGVLRLLPFSTNRLWPILKHRKPLPQATCRCRRPAPQPASQRVSARTPA